MKRVKENILRDAVSHVYSSWGFHPENKTWQNGAKSRNPLFLKHRNGKVIYIEFLEKPCKKKEDEIFEFYKDLEKNKSYKIIYLSNFSNFLKPFVKEVKKTLGANPVKLRHEMPPFVI